MTEIEGTPILMCIQVREDTIASVVPGATQGVCDKCDHRVWISRSGQAMMAERDTIIRCLECVMADTTMEELLKTGRAVPGAAQELLRVLRGDPDGIS